MSDTYKEPEYKKNVDHLATVADGYMTAIIKGNLPLADAMIQHLPKGTDVVPFYSGLALAVQQTIDVSAQGERSPPLSDAAKGILERLRDHYLAKAAPVLKAGQ